MRTVPRTLTSASSTGCSTETRTSACAARWKHGLRSHRVEEVVERLADVAHVQLGAAGDVLLLAVDERVDDGDLVAARDERIDDVRADEAGSSGHDRPHGSHPTDGRRMAVDVRHLRGARRLGEVDAGGAPPRAPRGRRRRRRRDARAGRDGARRGDPRPRPARRARRRRGRRRSCTSPRAPSTSTR